MKYVQDGNKMKRPENYPDILFDQWTTTTLPLASSGQCAVSRCPVPCLINSLEPTRFCDPLFRDPEEPEYGGWVQDQVLHWQCPRCHCEAGRCHHVWPNGGRVRLPSLWVADNEENQLPRWTIPSPSSWGSPSPPWSTPQTGTSASKFRDFLSGSCFLFFQIFAFCLIAPQREGEASLARSPRRLIERAARGDTQLLPCYNNQQK